MLARQLQHPGRRGGGDQAEPTDRFFGAGRSSREIIERHKTRIPAEPPGFSFLFLATAGGSPREPFRVAQASIRMSAGNAYIGKPAPDFQAKAVMPDGQFKDIKLSDYKGKYVVFFFYPLDFTFVCPTEIIAFSDRSDEFRNINCEVIAASVDSHFCHLAWVNTPKKQGGLGSMRIPLVSDTNRAIAKDYGVLKEDEGIAYRGLFIIDDKGILRQITINDLPVGRSVEETLRLVQAFQFTDKHGEVCPAGWQPGADTIKPDVKSSKEYFSKQK